MSQSLKPIRYEWETIPWRKLEVKVFKLQKRIYQASLRGDVRLVHRLQRLLVKSWSAKVLAVRKVSQDNQGKKTAGVDGVKALQPSERLELVEKLEVKSSRRPTRRVWIPKLGTDEKRPLGIPMIRSYCTLFNESWGSGLTVSYHNCRK
jgi:RNA-directed DNA polymerase